MNQHIDNLRDFRAVLAVGERLYSLYKYNQAGTPPTSIPDLCTYFDVGKTKLYELLRGVTSIQVYHERRGRNQEEASAKNQAGEG